MKNILTTIAMFIFSVNIYSQPYYIGKDGVRKQVNTLPISNVYTYDVKTSEHVSNMLKSFNIDSVNHYLFMYVNKHRLNNSLNSLKQDVTLSSVSNLQMNYQHKVKALTHYQNIKKYETSDKRANEMNLNYEDICENNIFGYVASLKFFVYSEYVKYNNDDVNQLVANYLFNLWKNSDGHNKVMLDPKWEKTYISMSYIDNYMSIVQIFKK